MEKDKLIDTQQGFVDTFNWAVQAIANLKGGENCEVTWPTDDTPTIDCNSSESEGGGGGGGGCDCDLEAELTSGTKIARWTKDGTNWTDIYCLSGGGGGLSAAVTDVGIQYRPANQPSQYDKLSVFYSDGTTKALNLPLDNAVKDIRRANYYGDEVLSVTYTRSTSTSTVDLGVEISGYGGSSTGKRSGFKFTNYSDSNVRFYVSGNEIKLGVYYV